jgi:hypothetical protein
MWSGSGSCNGNAEFKSVAAPRQTPAVRMPCAAGEFIVWCENVGPASHADAQQVDAWFQILSAGEVTSTSVI